MAKKKTSAKKPLKKAPTKSPAKKTVSKTPAKKLTKTAAKKSAPAKKAVMKKSPAKKAVKPVKKAAIKAPAKKGAAKKSAPVKAAPKKSTPKKVVTTQAPATKSAPKKMEWAKPTASKKLDLTDFVTPLDDRLIVQMAGAEKMTAGGLYIPDTVSDVSGNLHGEVVAVGRGHLGKKDHMRPMDVKVGDKVVFAEHAGSKIKIQNEDLIILREVDVMGIVSK